MAMIERQYNFKLHRALKERRWTQRKLADLAGMHHVQISEIVRGALIPSPAQRSRISDTLGLNPEDLFST